MTAFDTTLDQGSSMPIFATLSTEQASNPEPPSETSLANFTILKLLSTGTCKTSKVYLALDEIRSAHVALKVISKRDSTNFNTMPRVLSEQAIHRKLTEKKQPHFLPLVASWHDSENFYLATEYLRGGDMSVELMCCRTFEEERARFYAAELIVAIQYLHSLKIIHGDIKFANILFCPDGHVVLGDFGDAIQLGATSREANDFCEDSNTHMVQNTGGNSGTPLFMSPEQHRGERYSFEVDYWAIGVLLFRMLTGRMPFGGNTMDRHEIRRSVIHDAVSFDGIPIESVPTANAQDLLMHMLLKDPNQRISSEKILHHPFFAGINWTTIASRSCATPWPPFLRFIPFSSRTTLPFKSGTSYEETQTDDPFPDFTWCSPLSSPACNYNHLGNKNLEVPDTHTRTIRKARSLPLRLFNAFSSTQSYPAHTRSSPQDSQCCCRALLPLPLLQGGESSSTSVSSGSDCDEHKITTPVDSQDMIPLRLCDSPVDWRGPAYSDSDGLSYAEALITVGESGPRPKVQGVFRKMKAWMSYRSP